MLNNIFDTHAHYTDEAFNHDRYELLTSLPSKGIKYIQLASSSLPTSKEGIIIADKFNYIYTSVGIHPESINETPDNYIDELKSLASHNKVTAIGEIGLDYHYENYDKKQQIDFFEQQLSLAKELNMPVIIHSRDATEDCISILKKYSPKGVMHCFSGSAETAKLILNLGLYISFTGVLTFKNAKKAIEALKVIPLDRLMLETDCPYMAPVPLRGKRCDSSMITYIAEKAAQIKNINVQELLNITCSNGEKLFLK